jgi:APA family basic amino acid/polyamine antiporter
MPENAHPEPSRLSRRLGLRDAVIVGLGSMLGAGAFSAFGPAASEAGSALLIGLAIAAVVAYCNAASSADLAANYPESGGTYAYGRHQLGESWGFLAGWAFISGKVASAGAMAFTFAAYVAPDFARPIAAIVVLAVLAVNLAGVKKTATVTTVIVAFTLTVLAIVVASVFVGDAGRAARVDPLSAGASPREILASGAVLFFAFAGYARIATLGEEVKQPRRTIPRAILLALAIVLIVYAVVALSALAAVGAPALAATDAPLEVVVSGGDWAALEPIVRVGAAIASLGVLVALLAGIGRTTFAMAANRDMPPLLAAVSDRTKVPQRAEIAAAIAVLVVIAVGDVRAAIAFSSVLVLTYYAIANGSAMRLPRNRRLQPLVVSIVGLIGCVALATALPPSTLIPGAAVLGAGILLALVRHRGAGWTRRMPGDDTGITP